LPELIPGDKENLLLAESLDAQAASYFGLLVHFYRGAPREPIAIRRREIVPMPDTAEALRGRYEEDVLDEYEGRSALLQRREAA